MPASCGRIGQKGTTVIPKELKWKVKGLTSRVNLSEITSQLLAVGAVGRRYSQSREKRREGKKDRGWRVWTRKATIDKMHRSMED